MKNEKTDSKKIKKADHYNDPSHDYRRYWDGRDYEHQAEVMAIKRLLDGKHFKSAVDIGGGYGRLTTLLTYYADKVTLADPSEQQLDFSKEHLKNHPGIDRRLTQIEHLDFPTASQDLAIMIRVMHHLPDPTAGLSEISRILTDGGYAVIEVANYMHVRNRLKHLLKGQKMPTEPIDIRSKANRNKDQVQFVNHNAYTVIKQMAHSGLKVERILSVSNLRSPGIKRFLPKKIMLAIEGILQPTMANSFFGPSVFFLVKKQ